VVQGKVLVEAAQHHRQVLLLFASLPMPMFEQPLAGASEKLSAALDAWDADQGEPPVPIHTTDMLEAKELKRFRPLSMLAAHDGGKSSEEQHPSLVLGQFQIEPCESFPQLALEVLRVVLELEASHKIISKTHQVRLASAL
jgi:hypothetical protein